MNSSRIAARHLTELPASREYQGSKLLVCNPQKDDAELTIGGQPLARAKVSLYLLGPCFQFASISRKTDSAVSRLRKRQAANMRGEF
jgi:hypothetical protein